LSKSGRKGASHRKPAAPSGTAVKLKKEELQRIDTLRLNIAKNKGQPRPDVQSTLELMYLRVLGMVNDRGPLQKDLQQLKTLLDQAAAKITEILDKVESKK
jgi:hypothetical protein